MSSHENRSQGAVGRRGRDLVAHLFDVDATHVESLSWPLGDRVVGEDDATQLFRLAHRRSRRTVTLFEVTEYTRVVRLRTPVGREKFYGIADVDVTTDAPPEGWVRTE